jgi:hypothetical protein
VSCPEIIASYVVADVGFAVSNPTEEQYDADLRHLFAINFIIVILIVEA